MQYAQPIKPIDLDPLATELLTGLSRFPLARHLVLGGYFALKHYHDYRLTHDVDAWWDTTVGETERALIRDAIKTVLADICQQHGLTQAHRRFGDTESWELIRAGKKTFSFQISSRTVQLEPYLPSPWPPLQIEALADNLASKMNALVQRAAPRDFVDIYEVVSAHLAGPADCWQLWVMKNPDLDLSTAKTEVRRRLQELELRRPLAAVPEGAERTRAATIRAWFREVFLADVPYATGS